MKKIAVYPGSFDPITKGHMDVIERGLSFLDKVIVSVADYSRKNLLFTTEERVSMIRSIYRKNEKVEVGKFDGLLVDYMEKKGVNIILRGLRAVSDFEYEFQMVLANRKLSNRIETVFLTPGEEYFFISSSIVKEIAELKGDVSMLVPDIVAETLRKKFNY